MGGLLIRSMTRKFYPARNNSASEDADRKAMQEMRVSFCTSLPPGCTVKTLEHRAGIEPANTGFADLRVDRFATGASQK
jgi:hypothetical protein